MAGLQPDDSWPSPSKDNMSPEDANEAIAPTVVSIIIVMYQVLLPYYYMSRFQLDVNKFNKDFIKIRCLLIGCETWSLILREESRLRVFENSILRKIFGPRGMRMACGEVSTMRNFIVCTVHPI